MWIVFYAKNPLTEQQSKHLKVRPIQKRDTLLQYKGRTRWQRFKYAFFPYLNRSKELAYAYTEAKVEKERSEARKFAEQAGEIAARKDLIRQKSAKEFGAVVDDIFTDDGLPPGAKALKLAKLMEENPRVLLQLEKAETVIEKLSLKNNHENKLMVESQSYIIDNSVVENG